MHPTAQMGVAGLALALPLSITTLTAGSTSAVGPTMTAWSTSQGATANYVTVRLLNNSGRPIWYCDFELGRTKVLSSLHSSRIAPNTRWTRTFNHRLVELGSYNVAGRCYEVPATSMVRRPFWSKVVLVHVGPTTDNAPGRWLPFDYKPAPPPGRLLP